jgi:hypothetical protein
MRKYKLKLNFEGTSMAILAVLVDDDEGLCECLIPVLKDLTDAGSGRGANARRCDKPDS